MDNLRGRPASLPHANKRQKGYLMMSEQLSAQYDARGDHCQGEKKAALAPNADIAFVRRALEQASLNVLRLAMIQLTDDDRLRNIPVLESPIRGGALIAYTVAPEYHELIRQKAFAWLQDVEAVVPSAPSRETAEALIENFAGQPLDPRERRFGYEELAFETFPRDTEWTDRQRPERADQLRVIIIGAGISGIAAAIQLKRLGIHFRIFDRNGEFGGTWFVNTYPDARVDTSSYLYQFKFEKNYPWSEFFAARDETQKYLTHIVNRFGLREYMTFDTEIISADWDEVRNIWRIKRRCPDGAIEHEEAEIVISAAGLFNKPKRPELAGLDEFIGPVFHTTEWRHDIAPAGKRVALIGTGSTGSQLAPVLAEDAAHLTIFQRTPEWVMAFENYKEPITPEVRWLFDNIPFYWNWYCLSSHLTGQSMQGLQYHDRAWQQGGGMISPRNDAVRGVLVDYIRSKVGDDEDLVRRLTPKHAPLVRRLVVDNGFYDTIMRDNVDFVSGSIDRVTPTGIISSDGCERHFDAIVLGTGFETARYLWPVNYRGCQGATIEGLWQKDGARSYLGITMPGFPNLFMFYGPNGSPRSGGFYSWAEIWARYVAGGIVQLIEGGHRTVEVKESVYEAYNEHMDTAMDALIWESEGASYYVNEHGRSGIFMPWETHEYHAMIERFDPADFSFT